MEHLYVQPDMQNARKIWDYFMDESRIANPYGVAGLMGNLEYESMLNPVGVSLCDTKKNKNPQMTKERDELYYHIIPGGGMFFKMKDFVMDKNIQFGLAGWQWWARKQGLYNITKLNKRALCDLDDQLIFIWHELNGPSRKELLAILKNTDSIMDASNAVATMYIRDQEKTIDKGSLADRENRGYRLMKALYSNKNEKGEDVGYKVKWVKTTRDGVPIRTKPMVVSRVLGKAFPDERYRYIVSSKNNKWHCVYWPFSEQLGWLPARYSEIYETTEH